MPRRNLPPGLKANRNRRFIAGSALLAAGAAGGGIVASSLTAGAAPITTAAASGSSGPSSSRPGAPARTGGTPFGLDQSGTVSSVGTASVTITSGTGTPTTYAVVASSDIDKNGEAQLSSLVTGDKVRFNTVKSAAKPTIAHLHAGTESLDAPSHSGPRPGGGDMPTGPRPGDSAA
jgi:hypothetical protein